jgi:putative sterol carrier protein
MSAVEDILKQHKPHNTDLEGLHATCRFDILDEGSWVITVDDGDIRLERSSRAADCVVSCDRDEFMRLAAGEANLINSAMQGRIRVDGSSLVAKKLHGVLRERGPIRAGGGSDAR